MLTEYPEIERDISCGFGFSAPASLKCLYDLDEYHHVKGCRSLVHLQDCGKNVFIFTSFYNRSTHYFRTFSVKFANYAAKKKNNRPIRLTPCQSNVSTTNQNVFFFLFFFFECRNFVNQRQNLFRASSTISVITLDMLYGCSTFDNERNALIIKCSLTFNQRDQTFRFVIFSV